MGRALAAALENGFGDRFTRTASAEVVGAWIGRRSHHRLTPCGLWDAQTPARRPHRLSSRGSDAKSSWTLAAAADNTPGGAVTVTTSAEVVGSSIGRLSHHRMISSNVCDGLELVRRRHNGCVIMEPLFRALGGGGGEECIELFTAHFRAFCACREPPNHYQYTWCGDGTKSRAAKAFTEPFYVPYTPRRSG